MPSSPPPTTSVSNEELLATQARLYRLLVEATDRLERERGLPLTRTTELARLNNHRKLSDSADNVSDGISDDTERKGSG